jgi:hypothetical protein
MIIPQGGSAPLKTNFINFLGDPNTPSTGLTPEMLAAIMATQNPQQQGPPPAAAAAVEPPAAAARNRLADAMSMPYYGGAHGGGGMNLRGGHGMR